MNAIAVDTAGSVSFGNAFSLDWLKFWVMKFGSYHVSVSRLTLLQYATSAHDIMNNNNNNNVV